MPHTHEITGEQYYECDICGFDYKESETIIDSAGFRVCLEKCYNSPAIVIPRSIISSFQPTDISNCVLWVRANDITGLADGDKISTWSDKSGNNNNLTQATEDYQPLFKTDIWNGKSVVRFDGVDDYLWDTFTLSQPEHIFIIAKLLTDLSGNDTIIDGSGSNKMRITALDNIIALYATTTFNTTFLADFNGRFHLWQGYFSGDSSYCAEDNLSKETGSLGTTGASGITLGMRGDRNNNGLANIDIAEVVIYSAEVIGDDLTNLLYYLNKEYHLWYPVYNGDYL